MLSRRDFLTSSAIASVFPSLLASSESTLQLRSKPKQDGFYLPAEWDRHEYTIMQFVPGQNWRGYGVQAARDDWANVANSLSEFEPVLMVVDPDDRNRAKKMLSSDIEQVEFPLNDGWSRDSAPVFLVNQAKTEKRIVDFTFNGWGAKFPPYNDDAALKQRLSHYLETPYYKAPLVLEGGAITQNGKGTLITTEECLLHTNRNPAHTKQSIDPILKDYFGVEHIIWLGKGLTPDPVTDGHVDGIGVFVDETTVMLHTTNDTNDPNYVICQDAKQRLRQAKTALGQAIEIIELPLADDVAHINFYIANDAVIVPTADSKRQDDIPLSIIQEAFPERKVVGVSGQTLAKGGGGVHCITQQVPLLQQV